MLEALLKLGGVTALALGIFYLLYRQLLALKIFARLGAKQTFTIVCLLAVLVWSTAIVALIVNDQATRALIFGSGNTIIQGSTVRQ